MKESVTQRLETVKQRILRAEQAAKREAGSVNLLAVSKTQPIESIRQAWHAGQSAFGENYPQEALEKIGQLRDLAIEWHFIGRIQSNKTRAIAEHFAWVHSLCDVRHAKRLDRQRPEPLPPLNVCIQVNVSGESSKAGLAPQAVADVIDQCLELPRLRVRGLMAIPAPSQEPQAQRAPFRALRKLRDRLTRPGLALDTLSMGMSADLEAAIAEGATLVRVGTAIFGPRHYAEHGNNTRAND